jgi:hypothetical protein
MPVASGCHPAGGDGRAGGGSGIRTAGSARQLVRSFRHFPFREGPRFESRFLRQGGWLPLTSGCDHPSGSRHGAGRHTVVVSASATYSSSSGRSPPAARSIDVNTELGFDDDPERGAAPGRRHSSGTPALRSPAKYVASNKARVFGTPNCPPAFRRAMLE